MKGKEIRQTLCCMILLGLFRPSRSQRSMHFNHFELTDQWLLTITLFSCNIKVGELTTLTAITLHFSFIFTSFNASIHIPRMYPFHHSYYSEKQYSRVTCSLYCIHGLSEERIFEKYPDKTWWKTAKGSKFSINLTRLI